MRRLAILAGAVLFVALPHQAAAQTATPTAARDVDVAVLAHPVAKGDILSEGDFTQDKRSLGMARGAMAAVDVAGMEATRNLNAGAIVRRSDVAEPQLVRRGEPVTIRVVSGNLVIATSGRALAGGGKGDIVRVVATSTNRTLDAVVDGSGSVRIMAP
ncbi:MAG: flagellar basal body P-ring formation chaperone FlgA [Pseudomonadota bacterium]